MTRKTKTGLERRNTEEEKNKMQNVIHTVNWSAEQPKAIIHIIHGMSEHSARYEHFAKALNKAGYSAYSSDLRGHGKTAGAIENVGYFAENDGWAIVVQDLIDYTKRIKADNPDIPVFIFGHSMGSFFARNIAYQEPDLADGYIISGTVGHPGWKGVVGKPMSKLTGAIKGKKKPSKFLQGLGFAGLNKRVENKRTKMDWLSRDEEIVDKYINDPYCMQTFSNQFFNDLATGVLDISKKSNIEKVNKNTPVLFISGDMDPLGGYGKGPTEVFKKYKDTGVNDVELRLFEGGRHELLNETNREDVYEFVVGWIRER